MKKEKWIWMPHAAHFIGGNYCRFKLATYVGKYIVSTVGEWEKDEYEKKWDYIDEDEKNSPFKYINAIGPYETMVFKAKRSNEKHADYKCCPYDIIVQEEVETLSYKTATEAYKGHKKLCNKWSKK